jgi:hypothetical protein
VAGLCGEKEQPQAASFLSVDCDVDRGFSPVLEQEPDEGGGSDQDDAAGYPLSDDHGKKIPGEYGLPVFTDRNY